MDSGLLGIGKSRGDVRELCGLRLFPRGSAIELAGKEIRDARRHLDSSPGIEKQSACAASEDIIDSPRHLMPRGPDNLGAGNRQGLVKALAKVRLFVDELFDADGVGSVNSKGSELRAVSMESVNVQIARDAGALGQSREYDGVIDRIFGHAAIGGPLSAGNREHAR